jgi:lipoprotein-releasing system permease protein
MMFALRVALRYLTANRGQTLLLIGGVAVSVVVFVFITALINGLAINLTNQITGQIAHVELEPQRRIARVLSSDERFAAQPVSTFQRQQIRNWQQIAQLAEQMPHVISVSPDVSGNGFLVRGAAVKAVSVQGIAPDKIDAITPITKYIIEGSSDLSSGGLLVGADLAEDLGLRAGVPVLLRSDRGVERLIPVAGIFKIGLASLDQRVAMISLNVARPLFALPDGVSMISIKLDDPQQAESVAAQLQAMTRLKVTPWQEKNRNLQDALNAQGSTGGLIRGFAIIAILITITSSLLLSTVRRKAEIGIMRSFGISRRFVASIFVLQGLIIGFVSSLIGAGLGYRLCLLMRDSLQRPNGEPLLPIAPDEGGYLLVIVLTTFGSGLAAILPARAAARIDPVEAIQQ